MIVNNSTYQLLMEVPLDMIPNILFVIGIGILVILGLILRVNSTKPFLEALFNKFILLVFGMSAIWSGIIFMVFGSILKKYYSGITIAFTIFFSILILCMTSYNWARENYYLKKMFLDNFKVNAIFCVVIGLIPQLFTFNLWIFGIEFIKSLLLPFVLEILFLPIMYGIAVLNEYADINYTLPILSKDIMIHDVFKMYNINLRGLHRFNKQLNYKHSNNLKIKLVNSNESEFRLMNNNLYIDDELIGRYKCNVEIPEIFGLMCEKHTQEKKIPYIIGDSKLEHLSDNIAFVYFRYKNMNIKLFIEIKYVPMHIWDSLIEDICEFELV